MTTSKRITAAMLRDGRACDEYQLAVFRREWPHGVVPSEAACLRAAELGLDLCRFAESFLSYTALAAYEKDMAPVRAAYVQGRATALWSAIEAGGLANVLGEAVQE